nr:hypothetical protein [Tanacetum cinerariifolium]
MKVIQAYDATSNESPILPPQAPIAPPTVLPPSLKRARFLSSYSIDSSAPPQVFETRESSHVTRLECHEEQIKTILNHLDELPFKRIEHMEDKIKGLGFISRDDHRGYLGIMDMINDQDIEHMIPPTPPRDTKPPIGLPISLSSSSSVGSSSPVKENQENDKIGSKPDKNEKRGEAGKSLKQLQWVEEEKLNKTQKEWPETQTQSKAIQDALSWWNSFFQPIGIEEAYKTTSLIVKGNDLKTYVRRFQELAVLCLTMVPNNEKLMESFIEGLPRSIERNVTASKPQTLEESTTIAQRLMDQVTKHGSVQRTNDHKRKFDDRRTFNNNNNYHNNRNNNNNNNRNNDHNQQQNRRQETVRAYAATPTKKMGILETFPYVNDAPCITQALHYQVSDL